MKTVALLLASLGLALSFSVQAAPAQDAAAQAVVKRIKLAGKVCYEGEPCAAAPVVVAAATGPRSGEEVVSAVCGGCHAAGIMGAPKIADKAQWAPRIAKGAATLHKNAIGGINAMPAKGGCGTCSDDEIIAAVDYMIAQSK